MFGIINEFNGLIIIINIVTFILFGIDKKKSKGKGMRIPEIILLALSLFFFGGVGAILGMVVFNHKTSKTAFRVIVPLSFFINFVMSSNSFSILKSILQWLIDMMP